MSKQHNLHSISLGRIVTNPSVVFVVFQEPTSIHSLLTTTLAGGSTIITHFLQTNNLRPEEVTSFTHVSLLESGRVGRHPGRASSSCLLREGLRPLYSVSGMVPDVHWLLNQCFLAECRQEKLIIYSMPGTATCFYKYSLIQSSQQPWGVSINLPLSGMRTPRLHTRPASGGIRSVDEAPLNPRPSILGQS